MVKQGIIIAGALVALAGIGAALILSMGAPSQSQTAPGGAPPLTNPNEVVPPPPETGTAGDTTGNSTSNQSQSGATTSGGGSTGGLYGP